MSGNGQAPGLPGGPPMQAQRTVVISKTTRYEDFAIESVDELPDGGRQITFLVIATGERIQFPIAQQAAEKLGKRLAAPSVALPEGMAG